MGKQWMEGINAEAMDKWMADLRSGEYTQAIGVLRSKEGGMCCLGVATHTNVEICGITVDDVSWEDRYEYELPNNKSTTALMPVEVMDYLGIPDRYRVGTDYDGSIYVVMNEDDEGEQNFGRNYERIDGRSMVDVVSLNDSFEKTFPEIADRIEATYKEDTED